MYTPSASHEVGSEPIYKQLGVLHLLWPVEAEPLQAEVISNPHLHLSPPSCFALVIEHPSLHRRNTKATAGSSPSPFARAPRTSLKWFNNWIRIRTGEAKTGEGAHTSAHHRKPPSCFLTSSHLPAPACTPLRALSLRR